MFNPYYVYIEQARERFVPLGIAAYYFYLGFMPPKTNPKNLNPLQLRTLAIFQRLAQLTPERAADGSVALSNLPHPHGDHFHIGPAVISTSNATGLANQGAWMALERKGLIAGQFPVALTLLREGIDYPTGPLGIFIEHADH